MLREPKPQPLKKADSWAAGLEVPTVPNYRGRRANYRTGTASVGKRITGEVTGVGVPKRVQPGRSTARKVPGAGMRTKQVTINPDTMLPHNPGDVGKGQRINRARAITYNNARKHPHSAGWVVGTSAGIPVGLGVLAALRAADRRADARDAAMGKRDRRYNPEANRQRRLGVATAATGIGGAAALASGVRDIRSDPNDVRNLANRAARFSDPDLRLWRQPRKEGKRVAEQFPKGHDRPLPEEQKALHALRNYRTMVVDRRSAGKLGVGAGLLATSAGLAHHGRSRANREWR